MRGSKGGICREHLLVLRKRGVVLAGEEVSEAQIGLHY